ncbi:hypothetical protein EKH57_07145 [Halorubrum sp. BOL3-1]|uniref:hypothetical protein n=1 Tax=Halorubrum sp. BOL3-1 TaxID=2497325 RepID=UPI001004EE9E|nr:hypothetical protein [Halorubrum sp. BOL3-1]QAU12515.1 hypothetical protein EKH57_07145 [Halorubrum sp. BOL3-1]
MAKESKVNIRRFRCKDCGNSYTPTYHIGCDGLIVKIGDTWMCVKCGDTITEQPKCIDCDSENTEWVEMTVDVEIPDI